MGQTASVDALIKASSNYTSSPNERGESRVADSFPAPSLADGQKGPTDKRVRHIESVTRFFEGLTQTEILEYCLGFDKPGVPALAERVGLITFQCGILSQKPFCLLDIGLHVLQRKETQHRLFSPGPHSANLLSSVAYHHLRMQHNAHYTNCLPFPNDVEDNHFGTTRFVEEEEAKKLLEDCFAKRTKMEPVPLMYDPVRDEYAVLEADECEFSPIVVLNFDKPRLHTLQNKFGCHPSIWNNIVATISAQSIAREQGFDWRDDPITLPQLTNDLGINYSTSHSAADHAAYTLIDVIQMVMRTRFPLAKESIRSVVNLTMLHSQCLVPAWGKRNFCTQCGGVDHRRRACDLPKSMVRYRKCYNSRNYAAMCTHMADVCPW